MAKLDDEAVVERQARDVLIQHRQKNILDRVRIDPQ